VDVVLSHAGEQPDAILELVRQVTGFGRAEAGGLLANLPQPVANGLTEDEARALRRRFEEAGATVEVRASSRT
jgi:large subunit ribosomal protein L7/L12